MTTANTTTANTTTANTTTTTTATTATTANRMVTKAIKSGTVANKRIQDAITFIALERIKQHKDCSELTRLVKAFSRVNAKGETVLFKTGQAIASYTKAVLPIYWDKKSGGLKVSKKAFAVADFDEIETRLYLQSFDEYENKTATKAFKASSKFMQAFNAMKKIVDTLDTDDSITAIDKSILDNAKAFTSNAKYLIDAINAK